MDHRDGACTVGYSGCLRCLTSWDKVYGHSTQFSSIACCFPLCEDCWRELSTAESRLPFYRVLYEQWVFIGKGDTPHRWEDIEAAVRREVVEATR